MKLTRWVLGVCFVVSSLATYAQEIENKNVLDRIIVKVDNYFILKSEVESQYQQYLTLSLIQI
jgi:peptidyl-prolyl cis-trans isomerase SurA